MVPTALADIARAIGAPLPSAARDIVADGLSTDSRMLRSGEVFFALKGERFDGHAYVVAAAARGACACVVERSYRAGAGIGAGAGANVPLLAVEDVGAALLALAAWHRRRLSATVIAITGSNGKTTTKAMLHHVLSSRLRGRASQKSFNNHVGVPLTLLDARLDDEYLIVEIGSNAPGEVATLAAVAAPDMGLVTSIGCAHLAGLGGLDGVYREKMSLFEHVCDGGVALVNAQAVDGVGVLPRAGALRWLTYGDHLEADVPVRDICGDLHHTFALLDDRHMLRMTVPGAHNAVNACGVFALARGLGLPAEEILASLGTFEMPELRLNVQQAGSVTIIDDSYNANPSSMSSALALLGGSAGGRRVFVAGAMAELGARAAELHRELGQQAADLGVDLVVTVGAGVEARAIASGANRGGASQTIGYADVEEAMRLLPGELRDGDTVLVKGSRSAGLDVLARSLLSSLAARAEGGRDCCGAV